MFIQLVHGMDDIMLRFAHVAAGLRKRTLWVTNLYISQLQSGPVYYAYCKDAIARH